MELNEAKIHALTTHLQQGGGTSKEELAEAIGSTTRTKLTTFQNYLNAVAEKDETLVGIVVDGYNPYASDSELSDDQPLVEEDSNESIVTNTTEKDPAFRFFLKDDNNLVQEIEQVGQKGTTITFKRLTPKDPVDVVIKGKAVTVDILELQRRNPEELTEYGISVSDLIFVAQAAK